MVYILLLASVLFIGMGKVDAVPTYPDPELNKEVVYKIYTHCTEDCKSRKVKSLDCVDDCQHFAKWGIKYSEDK